MIAADDVEQSRLAGSVRAKDHASLALGHLEIDVDDRIERAETAAHIVQFQCR
jgi:hypothetical protein